jgi:uncharacterized protein (DUF4415 family)
MKADATKKATRATKRGRQSAKSSAARRAAAAKLTVGKRKGLKSRAAAGKRAYANLTEALKFYKPIKKPVTLRLDADVLAWFKREGRRYQTRINSALRKVMEREMERGQ